VRERERKREKEREREREREREKEREKLFLLSHTCRVWIRVRAAFLSPPDPQMCCFHKR
jgi:hypothetical protein